MKKEEIGQTQYEKILQCVMSAMMENGLKATTMDYIAASLQMSKRTLYEIFGSKEEMFKEAGMFYHFKMAEELKLIFENSANVMEAIIKCFMFYRDMMRNVSVDFIRDIEQMASKSKLVSEENRKYHYEGMFDVLNQGVKEGYFRNDINLKVQCQMLTLQMEALKRTEELFPDDITLLDVFDSIIVGFLRGISSNKGLEELEKFMPSLTHHS